MIVLAMLLAAASADPIPGSWEGTSLCQVKASPCHDEHVIYRIRATGAPHYRIDAYKLVNGRQLFMGAIDVTFDAKSSSLQGPVNGNRGAVTFALKGAHLSGRLTLADGTLIRLIEVDRR